MKVRAEALHDELHLASGVVAMLQASKNTKRISNAWSLIPKVLMMLVLQSNTRGKPKVRNMDYIKLFAAVSAVAALKVGITHWHTL